MRMTEQRVRKIARELIYASVDKQRREHREHKVSLWRAWLLTFGIIGYTATIALTCVAVATGDDLLGTLAIITAWFTLMLTLIRVTLR